MCSTEVIKPEQESWGCGASFPLLAASKLLLVYDFGGESTIKQVGWEEIKGLSCHLSPEICVSGMTDSDGSGRVWEHQQSWGRVQAAARSGQALFFI